MSRSVAKRSITRALRPYARAKASRIMNTPGWNQRPGHWECLVDNLRLIYGTMPAPLTDCRGHLWFSRERR